ncbi:MAG: sensor histidine kinase, partial [Candidatus Aenigmarchaeota archaeon]|nr:sensor histidine kinase [Candidatus Aenigmarchaeota archaeon]
MRLKGKLIVMFLAVAIVPLSAIVAVGTYRLENALMENALGQLDAVATIQEARISDAVVANTNAIRAFKTRLQLKTELAKYTQDGSAQSLGFINSLIKDVKSQLGYRDIHILDARGRIVASTDPGMVGANYSHEYAFARGMVAEDPTIVFKDRDGRLGLRLAGPLELNGTLIGVALIETDAENLLLPLREYAGLGETGESQLVKPLDNGDALYITPLRFYPDAALSLVEPRENADRPIIQALNKTEKIFTSALDYRGHEVLAVSKYIESAGWGLVVKKDKSEAFKPVEDLVYASLAVGILVIFFAVALSLFFAGSISRPISQLSSAMKELKRGNFKARVDIKTNDEFQELGESFNMAVRLAGQESEHKRLDRMKSEFLTMAGHELRSPMTPMRAQLQMLLAGYFGRIRARQKEALEIILRNSIRLDSIIRDFLEISRLETARLSFNFAKGDLRPHIKNVVREMEAFMPERGVSISLETGKLPAIEADTDRVSQVLRNLLSNA